MNRQRIHVKMEYSKITPFLYLGTNMCCNLHFKKISNLGIEADIDLEYSRHGREQAKFIKTFLWLPTRDHHAPNPKQLFIGAQALKNLMDEKVLTYVHCMYGHGRSPTLIAGYFILEGLTVNEAIKKIKLKRPEIHLLPAQKNALKIFFKRINE